MQDDFYKNLLDNLYDGVYFLDTERKITFWNKGAERLTGFTAAEVVGKSCRDNVLMHVDENGLSLCKTACPARETILDGRSREVEVYLHHKEGYRMPVLIRIAPLLDANGETAGAIEIFSDNSAGIATRDQIHKLQVMALLDPLTEVGNRRYAEISLTARLNEMTRYGWNFGVLFIDIDDFEEAKNKYGRDIANRLLRMVARTIRNRLRSFDTICRWESDKFSAIVVNIDRDNLCSIANMIRRLIEESGLIVESGLIQLTVSIGATLAQPKETVEALVSRGEDLVKQAKADGKNCVAVQLVQ